MPRRNPGTGTVVPLRPPTTPALPDTAVADGYNPALDVDAIDPNPSNVRRDLGDLTDLTASIAAVGVRHPITVTPVHHVDGGPRWLLVDGHRRHAAAVAAGLDTIPAIVRTDLDRPADVIAEMLRAGLHQQQLSPIEEATAYAQLELLGMGRAEIARKAGRARSTVEQRLHLMDLPESIRDRVHTRAITLDEAAAIAEFTALVETWPAAKTWTRELEAAAGGPDWRYVVARAQGALDGERKRAVARATATAAGAVAADNVAGMAHADCPGACAMVGPTGHITWLCSDPARYHPAPTSTPPATVDPAVVDEQIGEADTYPTEADKRADPWADRTESSWVVKDRLSRRWRLHEVPSVQAAHEARKAWLREEFLPGRKPLTAQQSTALAKFLCASITGYVLDVSLDSWALWLGVPESEVDDCVAAAALGERVWALSVQARDPQRALIAGLASLHEGAQVDGWVRLDGPAPDIRAWIELLCALGYEPCSWEVLALAPPTGKCRICFGDDASDDPVVINAEGVWWVTPDLCSRCVTAALDKAEEVVPGG